MKFLQRLWRWLFRREPKMRFYSELVIAYRPINRRDVVPILYRKKK
jgi:hypothetical protein